MEIRNDQNLSQAVSAQGYASCEFLLALPHVACDAPPDVFFFHFLMKLITKEQERLLLANGAASREGDIDPLPVVKLFTPDGSATWLLTELDPENPDIAFGLCDLGLGFPELGYVTLSEIIKHRGALGLPVERDRHFEARGRLSEYAKAANHADHIVQI